MNAYALSIVCVVTFHISSRIGRRLSMSEYMILQIAQLDKPDSRFNYYVCSAKKAFENLLFRNSLVRLCGYCQKTRSLCFLFQLIKSSLHLHYFYLFWFLVMLFVCILFLVHGLSDYSGGKNNNEYI